MAPDGSPKFHETAHPAGNPPSGPPSAPPSVRVSILVPVYNESESLLELWVELEPVLAGIDGGVEVLFVDDGSTDGSAAILDELAGKPSVRVLHLARNYGQTAAIAAAIDHSRGEILVALDADLQNDPADIPKLLAALDAGYDVASGWRRHRRDPFWTRIWPSRLANAFIRRVTGVPLHDLGCTLKAYRREVIEGVRLYGEMHRFIPIFAAMEGGRITEVEVHHRPRRHGRSKYGLERTIKVMLDLMLVKFLAGYSAKPIYVFGGFGLGCLLASLAPIAASVMFKVLPKATGWQKDFVETPLPTIASLLILVGFLALLQGLLSEMVMRTYFESQGKRPYRIRRDRIQKNLVEPPQDEP